MDKKKYTTGVMIGNAISPHIVELIEGIYRASADMQINVFFFLGIHSGYYYNLSKECSVDKDFDYQFNVVYDCQAFTRIDALIIEYGSLSLFLNKKEQKKFLKKFNSIPKVILEDRYTTPGTTSIISDNYNGMYTLVEHLIKDHGYRSFTYLAGPEGITDADERKKAVLDAFPHMEAMILFADLDHLKEINDIFGHAEGDFAIKYCGEKDLLIAEEMKAADLELYEVKKRRRESVRK